MLNAKKIALNVSKTELVIFSSPKKKLDPELKKKLNGKKPHQTYSVKDLGIHLDKYRTWKHQIKNRTHVKKVGHTSNFLFSIY